MEREKLQTRRTGGGEELQLTPEEAKTQVCGLQVPNQSLPTEADCVDFGSPTRSLLLPQEGLKLTLGPAGTGDVPNLILLRPAVAGGSGGPQARMGGGRPSPDVLVPGPHWLRPGWGSSD